MRKELLTKKIMFNIAIKEEARLKKMALIFVPALSFLGLVIVVTTQKTLDHLIKKDFFKLIHDFKMDEDKILPQMGVLGSKLAEEIFEGVLVFLLIGVIVFVIICKKTDIFSYPKRLRETKKYKN